MFLTFKCMLRSKTFFTLHKIQYALRKTMHISQGIIKDERKSKYNQLNLFRAKFEIHAGIWIKSNKIRQAAGKARKSFRRTFVILTSSFFFFLKVAFWLRKYPHTGVEINHACHPHAAQQSDPCFGVLWQQYGHVYPPCLVFSSEFSLSTQNALNNQTLQTILQSQALRDLSFGMQERPNMSQLR